MTDSNPSSEPARAAEPDASPAPVRPTSRLRRAAVIAIVAVALIAVIQRFAPDTDYQYAFLASAVIGLVAVIAVLVQLHGAARRGGHPWWVPAASLVALLAAVGLLRFESFSGEMVPQFAWRFASHETPPLVTELAVSRDRVPADASGERGAGEGGRGAVPAADAPLGSDPLNPLGPDSAGPQGIEDSPQFLGPNRTGVVDDRSFAVPRSADEVEVLWNVGIGRGWGSFAVSGDLAVTLEQRDGEECVSAYQIADGALRWIHRWQAYHEHPLGGIGPRSTPTIRDGRVYAQGATGRVWCLSLASGDVIWERDLLALAGWDQSASESEIPWGRAGSPLLVDDLCVLPFGAPADATSDAASEGRSLIAFDAASGDVRWTAGDAQISYASPQLLTLGGRRQIVIVNEKSITGHAVDSGERLWQFSWPGQSNAAANCAAVVPAGEDRFLVGKGYGGGSALVSVSSSGQVAATQRSAEVGDSDQGPRQEWSATEVWTSNRLLKTKFNHACVRGDVAYGIGNGALEAVDLETQELLWKQPRSERCGQGQLLLAGDTLIVQTEPGEVLFVDADPTEYQMRFRLPALSSKTWNIPTLAGQILLVRNDQQAIAYRLPSVEKRE